MRGNVKAAAFAVLMLSGDIGFILHGLAPARAQSVSPPVSLAPAVAPGDSQRLRDEIETVEGLLPRLPDRAAALYLLAHHYARLGDHAKALSLLKECVALDEGFNPADAKAFAFLKDDPRFRDLIDRVHRRYPPVHRARVAFSLSQNDLFPEGLAVDASTRVFYMGSMYHNKIVRFTAAGDASDFVKQDAYDLMPVGGVHVDAADHSVWCVTDPGEKNRSELVHFDAQGRLLERYPAPGSGPHDLNDFVLRGTAEIYVTDTDANRVFRFDRKAHRFAALDLSTGPEGRPVLYPNGITLSDDGNFLYIADILGVIRLDVHTNQVREVKPAAHDTLAGADGLYWYKGGLVGVQYGTGAFRVMHWKLAPDGVEVASREILERGTELVHEPTTGAILDGKFYFMANTGIDNFDNGRIVDPEKLEPLHIAVVPLQ
jgi:sugar lactone lactonase YvrE